MEDPIRSLALHFESILDILSDGVFISDVEGTTLFVNKMYETLTGLRQDEIQGQNIRTLVQQGIFDRVVNPQIVETGKPATHVQQLANGKRLVLTGYPVFDEKGQLCLVVTFARDITVLTQLQDEMTAQKKLIEQFHDRLAFMAREQTRELVPVFASREMKDVMGLVERFASSDATVLILGETGVGKDVVARMTHELSPRKEKMFLKVDCGGISESLTESELFGYMPGAFTGAGNKGKSGYFEMADGGTVFLDEVGELTPELQVKLLRVLQERRFERVGGSEEIEVDIRIVAATNKDLMPLVQAGTFREDLYYRLNVVHIPIPPLRERREDIPLLVAHFAEKAAKENGIPPKTFSMEALNHLSGYEWPGNIRQLQNVVERCLVLVPGEVITLEDLPAEIRDEEAQFKSAVDLLPVQLDLADTLERIEAALIRRALVRADFVQAKAAELLGISKSLMQYKLKKYSITGH